MSTVQDQLLAIRNKTLAANPETTAPATPEAVPTQETPEQQPEATNEPVATPETPETPPQTNTSEKVENVGWDDETPEEPKSSTPEINWNELGSAFEFGEVKTREEFLAKSSEFKTKLKELKETPLAGIPEDLKPLIEVAKTGDWKSYLGEQLIDYSKFTSEDFIVEFEEDFFRRNASNPKYFTDGKFDVQKAEEALDAMPEQVREQYGYQIIQAKANQQALRRQQIERQAQERRQQAEQSLVNATKNLGEILPLENYGIKFEPKHSSEIYSGITNSKLTKKHLGLSYEDLVRNGADMKQIVRTITLAEKGEKMIAYKSDNAKTQALKKILTETQNVQLNPSGTDLKPETPEAKPKTPAEKLAEYRAAQKKGL